MKTARTLKALIALLILSGVIGVGSFPVFAQDAQENPDGSNVATTLVPPHLSIEVPAAYSPLPGLSKQIANSSATRNYFGTEAVTVGAAAFGRAQQGAFYLTWVRSDRVIVDAEKTIRAALDELHRTPFEVNEVGTVQEKAYREGMRGGLMEMTWEWQSEDAVPNLVRVLAWKDDESHLHLAIGECVLASDAEGKYRETCQQALDSVSLSDTVAIANLGALEPPIVAPSGLPEDLSVPELETGDLRIPSSVGVPSAKRGEPIYQGKPKPSSESNSSRIYIGIGLALLGLAIYLTTRSDPKRKKSWSKNDPKYDPEAKPAVGDSDQEPESEDPDDDESDDKDPHDEESDDNTRLDSDGEDLDDKNLDGEDSDDNARLDSDGENSDSEDSDDKDSDGEDSDSEGSDDEDSDDENSDDENSDGEDSDDEDSGGEESDDEDSDSEESDDEGSDGESSGGKDSDKQSGDKNA